MQRMVKYAISEELLLACIKEPDNNIEGKNGRKIAQKRLNGHVLRAIIEEEKGIKTIVTVYKARSSRYEI